MTDIEQEARASAERFALIEAAVKVIERNVANNTAAWNTWNNLASSETFVRAILATHHAQPASPATREAVEGAVRGALWNVSNYPEAAQARMLGQDINGLVNAVMERLARFDIRERSE